MTKMLHEILTNHFPKESSSVILNPSPFGGKKGKKEKGTSLIIPRFDIQLLTSRYSPF
jgi:hypothetical protein